MKNVSSAPGIMSSTHAFSGEKEKVINILDSPSAMPSLIHRPEDHAPFTIE